MTASVKWLEVVGGRGDFGPMPDAPPDQTTVSLRPPGGEAPVTADHLAQGQHERMEELQAAADARNGKHVKAHHGLHGKQHRRVKQVAKLHHWQRSQKATLRPLTLTPVPVAPTPPA